MQSCTCSSHAQRRRKKCAHCSRPGTSVRCIQHNTAVEVREKRTKYWFVGEQNSLNNSNSLIEPEACVLVLSVDSWRCLYFSRLVDAVEGFFRSIPKHDLHLYPSTLHWQVTVCLVLYSDLATAVPSAFLRCIWPKTYKISSQVMKQGL